MPLMPRAGRVRAARITDLAAVGELSRLAHPAQSDGHGPGGRSPRDGPERLERPIRSLGLPVTASHISVFSLFRMPLGAFQPHDQLYVYEEDGRLAGLARVERDTTRDEWTVVELDAVDDGEAGDIRFRLVQHLLRDGSRRGASRFHVACADRGGNVELFMQAGFARYGEETVLFRPPGLRLPGQRNSDAEGLGIRPAVAQDALELSRLYRRITPAAVVRLEGYRLQDWEHLPGRSSVPRTSLTPILRLADVEAYVQEGPDAGSGLAAMLQLGVAKEQQPHYMRVLTLPEHDPGALIRFGLAIIGKRSGAARSSTGDPHRGVISCVRTYESPVDHRFEDQGMEAIATVSLLVKEALVRVEEPTLVPAI
ncbi:MAG TPA: hypothetical protein VJZ50_04110 [Candidatus Limnocylindrales bacterium]|nr:hypothetical protein [Candidatus Limnocylindrales bacterium]